jgi:hypothetical protein
MLEIEYRPLDDLKGATVNPKNHSIPELRQSIGRFGFAEAIVVDGRTGRLVAGHGRVEALQAIRQAGAEAPTGVQVDELEQWLVPVQTGWSSRDDAEAQAFLVAANRLTETGGWQEAALAELLTDIVGTSQGLEGVGYSEKDIAALLGEHDTITGDAPVRDLSPGYQIVVSCADERQQATLLEELNGRGLVVRAVVI